MFAKIKITGILEVKTGLNKGGNTAISSIGAVDSPVIRDASTNMPMIPGSSLKGKMRTLLSKAYNNNISEKPDGDCPEICSLFGKSAKNKDKTNSSGRLIFSDMLLKNMKELKQKGVVSMTEVKTENSINRLTAVANPRQIERVIRGTEFDLELIYEFSEKDYEKDIELIIEGIKLLGIDYLGGNGTRGYGRIEFKNLNAEQVYGDETDIVTDTVNKFNEGFATL